MNEQELCAKRLQDLSRQADRKGIVTFSDFLNLNEQNIYHSKKNTFDSQSKSFGGYQNAERQMIAFIPDALMFEWEYPIQCLKIVPKYPKFAEKLTHRDILGAFMSLGIERKCLGDILIFDDHYNIFCQDGIVGFLMDSVTTIRNTQVEITLEENPGDLVANIRLEERCETVASNRIDAILAKAFHLSRQEDTNYLMAEKVFLDGRCITNCNQFCPDGSIISLRGHSRFIFESLNSTSKKGKLRVKFYFYQ